MRWLGFGVGLVTLNLSALASQGPSDADVQFFEKKVRPILAEHCLECHDAKKQRGGLSLASREEWMRGGDTGEVIVPGNAEASRLLHAVSYEVRDFQMPPRYPLSEADQKILVEWIHRGAPDPRVADASAHKIVKLDVNSGREFWSFKPLPSQEEVDAALPLVSDWGSHEIDRFLLDKMKAEGHEPLAEADPRTLIRRLSYDLRGLPPSEEEVKTYLADEDEGAWERLVDRMLDSFSYGERQARWWMDVVRYADTNGQDENMIMVNAWKYRDWLVKAMNQNLSYDRFLTVQLAGDLLTDGAGNADWGLSHADCLTATGVMVFGPKMLAEQDKEKLVMDLVDEQLATFGRAIMGMTLDCARCHDHKFDPISMRDYYALAGIFKSTRVMNDLAFVSKPYNRSLATPEEEAALKAFEAGKNALASQKEEVASQAKQNLHQFWRESLWTTYQSALKHELLGRHEPVAEKIRAWSLQDAPIRNFLELEAHTGERAEVLGWETAFRNQSMGALKLKPGREGWALAFDGKSAFEVSHDPTLEPEHLTLECWVQVDEDHPSLDSRSWVINKNGNEYVNGHYALYVLRGRAGVYLNIGGGQENFHQVLSEPDSLPLSREGEETWVHLAASYDGDVLRLYLNGVLSGEKRIGKKRTLGTGPLSVGVRQDRLASSFFKGRLAEARIWNRALSLEEIVQHVQSQNADKAESPDIANEGLVRAWSAYASSHDPLFAPMVELAERGPEGVTQDEEELTLPADPDEQREGVKLTHGHEGAGMLFDGNSRLRVPHSDALEPEHFTLATWVKSASEGSLREASLPAQTQDNRRWLINKNLNEFVDGHFGLVIQGSQFGVYFNFGGGQKNHLSFFSAKNLIKENTWQHVAATYDGKRVVLYLDGKAVDSKLIEKKRTRGTGDLVVGMRADGHVHFEGSMDDVLVASRALKAEEVAHLMEKGLQSVDAKHRLWSWEGEELSEALSQASRRHLLWQHLNARKGPLESTEEAEAWFSEEDQEKLRSVHARLDEHEKTRPPMPGEVLAVEEGKMHSLPLHLRGSHLTLGKEPVPRGFLEVVQLKEGAPSISEKESGRWQLTQWLTAEDHPLTARVLVNRVWQAHFGTGLVSSSDNFGPSGTLPTHPELLDWLARYFVESGWDLKALHRKIVTSKAYRQKAIPTGDVRIPWIAGFPKQRLEAEMIRDGILAVSGLLDSTSGGVPVTTSNFVNQEYVNFGDEVYANHRRSLYLPVVRDRVYDALSIFDFANPSMSVPKRASTVVPHQALFFLNSQLVSDASKNLSELLWKENAGEDAAAAVDRIERAYMKILQRPPRAEEKELGLQFLVAMSSEEGEDAQSALQAFCHVLLASNEFIYRN